MEYPTIEEVEAADRVQLCRWWRFLDPPGMSAIDSPAAAHDERLKAEGAIMDRIGARMKEIGGFTPEISKAIGWSQR